MSFLKTLFGGAGTGKSSAAPTEAPTAAPQAQDGDAAWARLNQSARERCPIRPIEESEAQGDIAAMFEGIKREMQIPAVPNIDKVLAHSPQAIKGSMDLLGALYMGSSLPQPVVSMMLYSIAVALECQYCGSFHRLTCRSIGVDESMLAALGSDLGAVTPERVQAIIGFGVKASVAPKSLVADDFERLRDLGISDAEIVEIVALAGLGRYLNVITDALKIEVDPMIKQGLAA